MKGKNEKIEAFLVIIGLSPNIEVFWRS